jgi:limonene-1,2-epoxide hydrolase
MSRIDPHASWLPLQARAAAESDSTIRALIRLVRDHMEYEIRGQLDALMGTLTASPVYHFWNDTPSVLEGYDQVRGFYEGMIASGTNQFEVVVERIVADAHAVITEGQVKQVYSGAMAAAMGVAELEGEALRREELVLTTTQLITVWPAAPDGRLQGEDIYFGHNPFLNVQRIDAADLPDYYQLPPAAAGS